MSIYILILLQLGRRICTNIFGKMSNKRSRDTATTLVKDIRNTIGDDSKEEIEKRTIFIK